MVCAAAQTIFISVILLQLFAVGFDDSLVPVEGILPVSVQGTVSFVVLVDVDEAVSLLHLTRRGGDQVDRTPHRLAKYRDAIDRDRISQYFQMPAHVVDAVRIVDRTIFFDDIVGT